MCKPWLWTQNGNAASNIQTNPSLPHAIGLSMRLRKTAGVAVGAAVGAKMATDPYDHKNSVAYYIQSHDPFTGSATFEILKPKVSPC